MLVRMNKHLIKSVRYVHPPLVNLNNSKHRSVLRSGRIDSLPDTPAFLPLP